MDTRSLKMFLLVAKEKSISRAADTAFISRQALTEDMNRLERELGIKLFIRSNQGVTLTEEGAYFKKELSRIADIWDATLTHIKHMGTNASEIRLGIPLFFFRDDLIYELAHRLEVGFSTEIIVSDCPNKKCLELLSQGRLHIAVSFEPTTDQSIIRIENSNTDNENMITMSTANPLSKKKFIESADLEGCTVLVAEGERLLNDFVTYCDRYKMRIRRVPRSRSLMNMMLREGKGIEFLPNKAAEKIEESEERITCRKVIDYPIILRASAFYHRGAPQIVIDVANAVASWFAYG